MSMLTLTSGLTELFRPREGEFYNYAPCTIQTDGTTRYVFYCTNGESGIIVDYIGWRKGTLKDGTWDWSEERIALAPGEDGWDRVHVCDPDVLKGEFRYRGHTYDWALFYLGCDRLDCNHNQIGVAFADSIEGPWVKFDGNPVVSGAELYWGTGQCSEVSIDRKGRFKLVYRDADETGDFYKTADCDFSDMAAYSVGEPVTLTFAGMPAPLSMSHVAYDPARGRMYMAGEREWDGVVRCCRELVIADMEADAFARGGGEWRVLTVLDAGVTGKYGNHNPAFVRDPYGCVTDSGKLGIMVSSGEQSYIWSFRICEIAAKVGE